MSFYCDSFVPCIPKTAWQSNKVCITIALMLAQSIPWSTESYYEITLKGNNTVILFILRINGHGFPTTPHYNPLSKFFLWD